jgi:endogenous inhibitor of DNA gyrase (YacG/DUF329 family)
MIKDIAVKILVALPPRALDVIIAVTDPVIEVLEASPLKSLGTSARAILDDAVDRKLKSMLDSEVFLPEEPSIDTPQPLPPSDVDASDYFDDAAKMPKRDFCEKYDEVINCGPCAAKGRSVAMVFISATQANCPECQHGAEWPRPASELYPDKPWKCPRCGGEVQQRNMSASGNNLVIEWMCVGISPTGHGHGHAETVYGKVGADGLWLSKCLPRDGCGWHDTADNYGITWR